jgi:hypothetical protein
MAQLNVAVPNIPHAPQEYSQHFQDQYSNVLRLFFLQLNNPGALGGTALNLNIGLLPTQADFADLRSGDVYQDTSGGAASSYPLRIKA